MPTRLPAPLVLSAALACTPRPTANLSAPEHARPEVQAPETPATTESGAPEPRWLDLSIESEFGCAVERGGAVYCWGRGPAAQMGLRELPDQPEPSTPYYGDRKWGPPSRLEMIASAQRISTASSRACAIVEAGRLRCWGAVRWGSQHVYDVAGITDAVDLEIGDGESCAMTKSGELWCWGPEDFGIPQARMVGAVAMTVSDNLGCGLSEQGDILCWGQGVKDWHRYDIQFKQRQQAAPSLGPQGLPPEPDPDTLPDLLEIGRFRGAVEIALSGWNNLCVLQRDGKIRCSTQDVFSMLSGQELEMREIEGASGLTSLATTRTHSCATTQARGAVCWGRNVYGQLGDGGSTMRETAAPVTGLDEVERVAVTENASCATTSDDRLLCWGYDLGEGLGHEERHVNTVAGLRASSIAAFGRTTCAVDDAKLLRCWGSDMLDQVGIAAAAKPTPVGLSVSGEILGFNTGWEACFLVSGQPLQCGNWNAYASSTAQFSAATTVPEAVAFAAGSPPMCLIAGKGAKAEVRCGQSFTAFEAEGRLKAPTAVSAAQMRACVVHGGGQVSCFAELYTWNDQPPPPRELRKIAGIRDAVSVASSTYSDCALHKSGKVSCWVARTESEWSEDGRTPLANHYKPSSQRDMGLSGARQVVAGGQQHCALLAKGAVRCWGDNPYAETTEWKPVPELGEIVELAAGSEHVCARDKQGAVTCWGDDVWGQLGSVPSRVYLAPTELKVD